MKAIVLVAGVDYGKGGADFRVLCDNRMRRRIIANRAKDDLTFHIFDFRKGEVAANVVTYVTGAAKETVTKSIQFTPITAGDYTRNGEHFELKRGPTGRMSILDVYRLIRHLGNENPGTLIELSIFSHAFHRGPILTNSSDQMSADVTGALRDPDDLDGRSTKDFRAPTMDADQRKMFAAAFAAEGFVWLWGCGFPVVLNRFLSALERNSKYRGSGLGDEEALTFVGLDDEVVRFLRGWVGPAAGVLANRGRLEIEFRFIKYFLSQLTAGTYAHEIAVASGVKTFAALQGTYSVFDTDRLALMSISPDTRGHTAFYVNYLGIVLDPEGRKYGTYLPGFRAVPPAP